MRKKRHPEMPCARSRPGIRPSGGFVAHLAFDHQMTPALFRPLFRASRSRGLHWRTGCRARLRRPSDLKHHAACREGCRLGSSVGPRSPDAFFLAHHAAPGCGRGMAVFGLDCALHLGALGNAHCGPGSFGQRPPDTFFLAHHAAPDCGEGKAPAGRTAPCTFGALGEGEACT